jgi:hypothetical protein
MLAACAELYFHHAWYLGVARWNCRLLLVSSAPTLRKRARCAAVVLGDLPDDEIRVAAHRLVHWAIDAGCEEVTVFDEAGVALACAEDFAEDFAQNMLLLHLPPVFAQGRDVVGVRVNRNAVSWFTPGQQQQQQHGRVVQINLISATCGGRAKVLDACKQARFETSQELFAYLDSPRVDVLFVCGGVFGSFPPLSLKTCEIYYVSSPPSRAEFCLGLEVYARSEQRLGT